jgi:hypothetical protein
MSRRTAVAYETDAESVDEFVTGRFEACDEFGAGDGVCSSCGWLSSEHPLVGADVRELPRQQGVPSRAAA